MGLCSWHRSGASACPSCHISRQSSVGLVKLLLDCEGAVQNLPMPLHVAALPLCSHQSGDALPAASVTSTLQPRGSLGARLQGWFPSATLALVLSPAEQD